MSAIAFVSTLVAAQDQLWLMALVRIIAEHQRMPPDAPDGHRISIRDQLDHLGDQLAAVIRTLAPAAREVSALRSAINEATIPSENPATPCAGDPSAVFFAGLNQGFVNVSPEVDAAIRRIILTAASTVGETITPRAGRWSAQRTGRPVTPPDLVRRAIELRNDGQTYKAVAKQLREEVSADISSSAIRSLISRQARRS